MHELATLPNDLSDDSVAEVLHGVEVRDPYRWLEDQDSPRTRRWIAEQQALARSHLDRIPGRDRIRQRIAELLSVETVESPLKAGNRYFFLKRAPGQDQSCIFMREGIDGDDLLLVDPSVRGTGAHTAVRLHSISGDGSLLAYEVRYGGERTCEIEFLDINKRESLQDRLPRGIPRGLAFSPDSRSIYYVLEEVKDKQAHRRAAFQHFFGTSVAQDKEIFFAGDDPRLRLVLGGDNTRLSLTVFRGGETTGSDHHLWNLATRGPARLIVQHSLNRFGLMPFEGRVFAITDRDAPNFRILELINPDDEEFSWREVVPTSNMPIRSFAVRSGRLLVNYVRGVLNLVVAYDLEGKKLHELALPEDGTTHPDLAGSDAQEIFFSHESFTQPPAVYRYLPETGQRFLWSQKKIPFDAKQLASTRVSYPSKDGTQIPMYLVGKNDVLSKNPKPTILTAYGGFGKSSTPQFGIFTSFMMENGCLFALANIRGGGEFGSEWHEAAKGHKRQNAFDDFIAAATWLIQSGYTEPRLLAIFGGSNSGLLIGAALTQQPELFRAAFCMAPLLDMVRYHRFGTAYNWVDEYGSPDNPADFSALYAYSPYHRVQDGVAYPPVLFISGDADMLCDPMHARKMTARLQAATSSDRPILLDYRSVRGHTPVLPLSDRIEGLTDRTAFVCEQLGIAL